MSEWDGLARQAQQQLGTRNALAGFNADTARRAQESNSALDMARAAAAAEQTRLANIASFDQAGLGAAQTRATGAQAADTAMQTELRPRQFQFGLQTAGSLRNSQLGMIGVNPGAEPSRVDARPGVYAPAPAAEAVPPATPPVPPIARGRGMMQASDYVSVGLPVIGQGMRFLGM